MLVKVPEIASFDCLSGTHFICTTTMLDLLDGHYPFKSFRNIYGVSSILMASDVL